MSTAQNKTVAKPTLTTLLDLLKKDIFTTLNCHAVGIIQSFDASAQTAQVSLAYKRTFFQGSSLADPLLVDYPVLMDAPVIIMGGGPTSLTFPIAKGDECLILFNDRDIDNWFSSGQIGPLATQRLHSFSDGFVLIGPRSLAKSLTAYDTVRAVLQNGTTLVGVGPSLVKIANNLYTLNSLLQELVNDVKSLVSATAAITVPVTTAPGTSGLPSNAATITAVNTSLSATATKIGQLLE